MLPYTLNKIAGHANIERAISFAGKYISAGLFAHILNASFPRRRESTRHKFAVLLWIPACAGKTERDAGRTERDAGRTDRDARMTNENTEMENESMGMENESMGMANGTTRMTNGNIGMKGCFSQSWRSVF